MKHKFMMFLVMMTIFSYGVSALDLLQGMTVMDESYGAGYFWAGTDNSGTEIKQSAFNFSLNQSATINSVELYFEGTLNAPVRKFNISIETDNGSGSPSGTLAWSNSNVSFLYSSLSANNWVNFTFVSPLELSVGTYWVVVHSSEPTGAPSKTIFFAVENADNLRPLHTLLIKTDAGAWTNSYPASDATYQLWGSSSSDTTLPNITQINFTSDGGAICSFPTNCANTTDLTPTFSLTISEVATCRMSTSDQNYDAMSNTCSGNGTSSASCTQSTELSLGSSVLYFACVDTSGNNNTAPLANNFKANITMIEDTTVPSVNQSTIIVTNAISGSTNWQSNYNTSVRVQNRRPSTNFTLNMTGSCAVSTFAGNYSAIIADDATTLCSTTQNATAQICQLPLSKKLIDGNDFIYFGCQNKYGYQSSNYTFYGNISQDYEFIGNVTDNDNNALANATVVFMYQSNNSVLNVSTTNATGWVSGVFFNNPSTLFTIHAYMSTNVSKGGDIEIFVNTTS